MSLSISRLNGKVRSYISRSGGTRPHGNRQLVTCHLSLATSLLEPAVACLPAGRDSPAYGDDALENVLGAEERSRTSNRRFTKALLCQLSYLGEGSRSVNLKPRDDVNRRLLIRMGLPNGGDDRGHHIAMTESLDDFLLDLLDLTDPADGGLSTGPRTEATDDASRARGKLVVPLTARASLVEDATDFISLRNRHGHSNFDELGFSKKHRLVEIVTSQPWAE